MDSDDNEDYSYSDVSRVSIFSEIDTENGEYTNYVMNHETNNDMNNETDNDNDANYDVDINRIRDMYDRNSLYTEPRRNTYINENYEDDNDQDNDDLYSIMDFYTQPYAEIDDKVIEPVMQLPLSSNQLMLMKRKWDKQLDMDLTKTLPKQTSSWSVFSMSRSSDEYSELPRNSHFSQFSNKSEKSEKSTKSSKSWKSFFSKFTKKSKKPQIKFYDNLVKR
jgi:hypothetical protein